MERIQNFLRGPRWRLAAAGSLAVVCLVLVLLGSSSAVRVFEMKRSVEGLQREIQTLEAVNDQLSRAIDRLRDDPQLVEQIAREELGMVKPGERVLRFPRSPESTSGTSR
ncbi:MAG TPA: septum formation initiator family protein [Methylomirabilota bacterium]|nr:septum formation initiator family protein [Methylomirabilota bacterium]